MDRVIVGSMTALGGPIRTAFRTTELRLAPRTRADLEAELKATVPAQARRAQMMLKLVDEADYDGIDLDWDRLAAHPYQREHLLHLFAPGWERRDDAPMPEREPGG